MLLYRDMAANCSSHPIAAPQVCSTLARAVAISNIWSIEITLDSISTGLKYHTALDMTRLFVRVLAAACITQSVSARKNVLFFAVDGKLLAGTVSF